MIIASIPHNGEKISVEITDVFTSSRGKLAHVRALEGEPFPVWTMGGWAYSSVTNVPADSLQDIALQVGVTFETAKVEA